MPKMSTPQKLVACPKAMAGVGNVNVNRIHEDAFHMAAAGQKACSSEMSRGQGADFVRMVALWITRSSNLQR